jgi:histidyl-tRNA synthetase
MGNAGYDPFDTPIIQPTDLFLTRAGDQIVKRLFTFERDGQSFALRPEFTASAAHLYAQQHTDDAAVVRWQFSGFIFVDYPAGAQQRYSIGAELFGANGAPADAEVIGMAARGLDAVGVRAWRIAVGHVGLLRQILATFQLDARTERLILHHLAALSNPAQGKAYVMEQLDRLLTLPAEAGVRAGSFAASVADVEQTLAAVLDSGYYGVTTGGRDRADIARRLIQKRQRATERHQVSAALDLLEHIADVQMTPDRAFAELDKLIPDATIRTLLLRWRETVEQIIAGGVPVEQIDIRPGLARDWEYYTGIVFELKSNHDLHLGGGGRYDELVKLLGGQVDTPAVGFVYHADQLIEALQP